MAEQNNLAQGVLGFGPFQLFVTQKLLLEGDQPVRLGGRALDILTLLAQRAGQVVAKDELMAQAWPNLAIEETNLRVQVAALRKVLGESDSGARYIINVAGRGYSFVAPVAAIDRPGPEAAPAPDGIRPYTLPTALSRIIGRGGEVAALVAQLQQRRLVTIVGAGGVGKTTVALAVAGQLAPCFIHHACLVDFGALAHPDLVCGALRAALRVPAGTEAGIAGLTHFLREMQMLIVLDSCEHLLEAVSPLAEALLRAAPGVRILATSRERLRAEGEWVYRLPSMDLPPRTQLTAREAMASPAVQLFVERASASQDGFVLTDADAPFAADICRRLEGIPLALELAAAGVGALGLRELAARIDDRFELLVKGRRTALPRHRTLRATLDWSCQLLSPREREIMRRLSVLRGSFTLEAATAVAQPAGSTAATFFNDIADLADKSLITVDISRPQTRYRLLDTTRTYLLEKLAEAGELAAVARVHASYFRDTLRAAASRWDGPDAAELVAGFERDLDNLRSALAWALGPEGDRAIALALAVAGGPVFLQFSLFDECRFVTEQALAALTEEGRPSEDAMRLHAALGSAALHRGERDVMVSAWTTSLAIAEALGNVDFQLRALGGLITSAMSDDLHRSLTLARRFAQVAATLPDPSEAAIAERIIGYVLHLQGDQPGARWHVERMLERYIAPEGWAHIVRFNFDPRTMAISTLAQVLWLTGQPDQALDMAHRAVAAARAVGHVPSQFFAVTRALIPVTHLRGILAEEEEALAQLRDLAPVHGPWALWNVAGEGVLAIRRGDVAAGLARLRDGIAAMSPTSFSARFGPFVAGLVEGHAGIGQRGEALAVIGRALAQARRSGEAWYEPELLRLQGEVLLADGAPAAEAEALFLRALALARSQGASAWALRVAMSLFRLWRDGPRAGEGRALLAGLFESFTEGLATADLTAARGLLAAHHAVE
ncbi:transcriptional regulator [Humitalea rosea]|uniref:Transcriptional regulator n=1 Tax=Humitalea rosea TaxID=990373 RepID=A0A2W7IM55_9PROT|nr:winged helix-turn-helix domain-containing protein [Humitalea rosea]PZW48265.1 transcriptional regulator [Humitalea rosea]